jgi:peptidoglycan-associated lipoprotein
MRNNRATVSREMRKQEAFIKPIEEGAMFKRGLSIFLVILCVGWVVSGCPKKTLTREELPATEAERLAAERQQIRLETEREKARLEAERKEKEAKELARLKEEEAKKTQAQKDFEKSFTPQKTPGIQGEIFESKMLKDIHFDFDKYDVRPEDAAILKENAALLAKAPNVRIQVEGHCDERGTIEYNLALGQRRANGARNFLISLGISENRISTISYGKERPLDPGHTEEAWAKNRRAHFIVLSK